MTALADEPILRPGLYRLPEAPISERVLIPGFRAAKSVRGAFGWFTAGWISQLAHGLADYLNREGTATIVFTVAPLLYPREREAIEVSHSMTPEEATRRIAEVFVDGRLEADALGRHALDCLSWMIAHQRLLLRVAVPSPGSNYHPKIWLFDDGEHRMLVRGSANATGRGIGGAVEHMDVDVSWDEQGRGRVAEGTAILDDWEEGRSLGIAQVVDMPEALRQGIVKTAPSSVPTAEDYRQALLESEPPPITSSTGVTDSQAERAERLRGRFRSGPRDLPRLRIPDWLEWQVGDYAHQGEAVAAWESAGERGTIEMATGAGKTLTALVCAARSQQRLDGAPLLVVVSAPTVPLVLQWQKEVKNFGVDAVAPTIAPNPNVALTNLFRALGAGGTHVAIVTNTMLCSAAFQKTVRERTAQGSVAIATMLIADEAHKLGAKGFIANKPDFFQRRLALSATPERQHDPDGTEEIFAFFGPAVYQLGLDRAIGFCLTPYDYYVHATVLDASELEEFSELTDRIRRVAARLKDEDDDNGLMRLRIKRRRIIETAQSKLPLLREVLRRREPRSLDHALIYASAKNPEQFDGIDRVLSDLEVRWAPVTQETTASPGKLNERLGVFSEGGIQVLLAKKVLDEGVDIPSIREAFLVASSTIQREWIQRRGRILRRHPGKRYAVLHDFVALPPTSMVESADPFDKDLKRIVLSELSRALSFAAYARNAAGDDGVLAHLEGIKSAYWPAPENANHPILQAAGDHLIAPSTPRGSLW